jgi:hypothetical protein
MNGIQRAAITLGFAFAGAMPALVQAQIPEYDKTFFDDYSHLQPQADRMGGTNLRYIAPGARAALAKYNAVMVDEPEVLISAQSDYKGAKPTDLQAMANAMRNGATTRLKAGGYKLVDAPGPDVLYVRAALTDVELTKKKRRLLAYTPAGAVVHFGTDMLKNVMQKYDIMNMVFQVELVGSESKQVIGQYVMIRGGAGAPVRIDFDQLESDLGEFADRLNCWMDVSKLPADQLIDCTDPAARAKLHGGSAH